MVMVKAPEAVPVIEALRLTKRYGKGGAARTILNAASFKVRQGEFVALVGPSGSGKSSLMHILGLLDQPTSGDLMIRGVACSTLRSKEMARLRNREIGFVFQSYNLLPRLSVLHNIELPLVYAGLNKRDRQERALRTLERVGLSDKRGSLPDELSGGEQQRVAIARALAAGPSIILADEPTGALDTHTGEGIIRTMISLNKAGCTIFIVTHDLGIAKQASRVISIRDGCLVSDERVNA
jgi:putative ABC transport system ATP-binding protein